jgi:hypothetical protein
MSASEAQSEGITMSGGGLYSLLNKAGLAGSKYLITIALSQLSAWR